jgi:hypothetical protein
MCERTLLYCTAVWVLVALSFFSLYVCLCCVCVCMCFAFNQFLLSASCTTYYRLTFCVFCGGGVNWMLCDFLLLVFFLSSLLRWEGSATWRHTRRSFVCRACVGVGVILAWRSSSTSSSSFVCQFLFLVVLLPHLCAFLTLCVCVCFVFCFSLFSPCGASTIAAPICGPTKQQ